MNEWMNKVWLIKSISCVNFIAVYKQQQQHTIPFNMIIIIVAAVVVDGFNLGRRMF